MRDWLAIGLMMAAGLRREEATSLQFTDVKKQNERHVLNVKGKGTKDRVVLIANHLAEDIVDWGGLRGLYLTKPGKKQSALRAHHITGLYNNVHKRGALIGKPEMQPHNLRWTYTEPGRRPEFLSLRLVYC